MIVAFKEYVLPLLIYFIVWMGVYWALFKRTEPTVILYTVLICFPQFWMATQPFPLGSQTLTLLVISILIGTLKRPPEDLRSAPNGGLILVMIVSSYLYLWLGSHRYGLPMPITGANEMLDDWKNYSMMLLLYFAAYRALKTEKDIKILLVTFAIIILLTSWREVRNFYGGSSFSYARRAEGTFPMYGLVATHYGAFIAHVQAILLGAFAFDDNKRRRWLYLAAIAAGLYPLFYSYSRAAYIALVAAAAVIGAVRYRPLLLGLAVLGLGWQVILPDTVVERMTTTENEDGELEQSAALRLVMWDLAKQLFSDNPVFGVGFQSFFYASAGMPLRNAHNYFLQIAAEQGMVGILILTAFFWKAARSGWRLFRLGSSDFLRGAGLGFLACVVALLVSNFFGDRFSQLAMGSLFWLMFGAVDRGLMLSQPAGQSETSSTAALQSTLKGGPLAGRTDPSRPNAPGLR